MAKFNDIRELAQQNARWVSNSPKDWMNYLDVAARLYRYSFKDTLLIHAQRPDATACAELEVWNKKMNRWVNRGAKGIALLDDASPRAKLRYVFDIADTHAEMAALVQQTIPKMQRLTEPQFKGLELEWHRPEDDAGK